MGCGIRTHPGDRKQGEGARIIRDGRCVSLVWDCLEHCVVKDSEAAFELSRKELKSLSMRRGQWVREIKASTGTRSKTRGQKDSLQREGGRPRSSDTSSFFSFSFMIKHYECKIFKV